MAGGKNYSIPLTQFGDNIILTWRQLQIDKDFCDVTLACEDGQIGSHRIIVSHSSPVLKHILKQSSNQDPVIYLRGVKYKYLKNLVSFMHQGEVTVSEEDLESFLDVAEDLKITGLSPENRESFPASEELSRISDEIQPKNKHADLHTNLNGDQVQQNSMEPSPKRKPKIQNSTKLNSNDSDPIAIWAPLNFVNDFLRKSKLQNLETLENNKVSKPNKENHNTKEFVSVSNRHFSCNICKKQYTQLSHLTRHKASVHEGIRYPCDQCDAEPFTDSGNLRKHTASAHEGFRYSCDQCDAAPFTQAGAVKRHKASVHEGVRYSCDQCDAAPFSNSSSVRQHKASEHEGIRYECNTCEYKATRKWHLKNHTKDIHKTSAHEGVRYPCDQCDTAPFSKSSSLRQHKASAHEGIRYECNTCDYKATRKWLLKNHTRNIHNI